jgi:hypothetical protein
LEQRLVAGIGALGVFSLALLPLEHLHVTRTPDGHHSDVVHRHYAPHRPISGTGIGDEDHDDQPQWLDSPFISPELKSPGDGSSRLATVSLPIPPPLPTSQWTPRILDVSAHDPPWAAPPGLRAPPFLSA